MSKFSLHLQNLMQKGTQFSFVLLLNSGRYLCEYEACFDVDSLVFGCVLELDFRPPGARLWQSHEPAPRQDSWRIQVSCMQGDCSTHLLFLRTSIQSKLSLIDFKQ